MYAIRNLIPAGNPFFKRNTRPMCEVCLKVTIKTLEQCHWGSSGIFIGNFEQISQVVLLFLLLTLKCRKYVDPNIPQYKKTPFLILLS